MPFWEMIDVKLKKEVKSKMPKKPNSYISAKEQDSPALVKPTLRVQIALSLWMAGIFVFYLLIYTPPFIWTIAGKVGLSKALSDLLEQAMPFFQTTDFSIYVKSLF